MNRVLPGRSWTELSIDHPIFHCVYDLRGPMSSLRVPSMQRWNRDYNPDDPDDSSRGRQVIAVPGVPAEIPGVPSAWVDAYTTRKFWEIRVTNGALYATSAFEGGGQLTVGTISRFKLDQSAGLSCDEPGDCFEQVLQTPDQAGYPANISPPSTGGW